MAALSPAPGCDVHDLRGPGRAGQHGAGLPDGHPVPLPGPLLGGSGQAEVALLRGRALLPRLLQGGAVRLVVGGCCPGHVSASFPVHWCPSPWVYPQGGLLGQPQALAISPGCIRAPTECEREGTVEVLSLGINPTATMSCFGGFMLFQYKGHLSPSCCPGNILSACGYPVPQFPQR